MRVISYLMGLGLIVGGMYLSGKPTLFFDLPSLLIVWGPPFFCATAMYSPKDIIGAVHCAFGDDPPPEARARRAVLTLKTLISITISSALVGTLIGLVTIVNSLDGSLPLGPALGVMLLCPLYGAMLSEFLLRPLLHRLLSRTNAVQ